VGSSKLMPLPCPQYAAVSNAGGAGDGSGGGSGGGGTGGSPYAPPQSNMMLVIKPLGSPAEGNHSSEEKPTMRAGTPGAAGGQVALMAVSPTSPKPRMDDTTPYLSVSGMLCAGETRSKELMMRGWGRSMQTRRHAIRKTGVAAQSCALEMLRKQTERLTRFKGIMPAYYTCRRLRLEGVMISKTVHICQDAEGHPRKHFQDCDGYGILRPCLVKPVGLEMTPDAPQPVVDGSARYVKFEPSLQSIVSAPRSVAGPWYVQYDANTCCAAEKSRVPVRMSACLGDGVDADG
jgi:hypothetical protein